MRAGQAKKKAREIARQFSARCPKCFVDMERVKEWCHDHDDQCACETTDRCPKCGYQHFETCANASPQDFGEPKHGDTWWHVDDGLSMYDGEDWQDFTIEELTVPSSNQKAGQEKEEA
jgi:hypothetical protein